MTVMNIIKKRKTRKKRGLNYKNKKAFNFKLMNFHHFNFYLAFGILTIYCFNLRHLIELIDQNQFIQINF